MAVQDITLEEETKLFFRAIPETTTLEEVAVEYGFFLFGRLEIGGGTNQIVICQDDLGKTLYEFLAPSPEDNESDEAPRHRGCGFQKICRIWSVRR